MTAVPLHIKRQFEQRWASRFTPPASLSSPQNIETKSPTIIDVGAVRQNATKDQPGRRRADVRVASPHRHISRMAPAAPRAGAVSLSLELKWRIRLLFA